MASNDPELRRGRIIWASVRDRRGQVKERPPIVLTATDDIKGDAPIEIMAITTTFTDPPPDNCVPLPWHPRGRALTRLRRRSAAVLDWVIEIRVEDVLEIHGDVPIRLMIEILSRLDASEK